MRSLKIIAGPAEAELSLKLGQWMRGENTSREVRFITDDGHGPEEHTIEVTRVRTPILDDEPWMLLGTTRDFDVKIIYCAETSYYPNRIENKGTFGIHIP